MRILSYGGDYITPRVEDRAELRRIFLERLHHVAAEVLIDLLEVARVGVRPLAEREVIYIPGHSWFERVDSMKDVCFSDTPELKPLLHGWATDWHLSELWVIVAAERTIPWMIKACELSEPPDMRRLADLSINATNEGARLFLIDSLVKGGPVKVPFTAETLTPTVPHVDLPPWLFFGLSKTRYRSMAISKGADPQMLDAWFKWMGREFRARGLVRAPKKQSAAHIDALIRQQCLEWPWDCVLHAYSMADPDNNSEDRPKLIRNVGRIREAIGLAPRESKRGGARRHGGRTDCLCPNR